MQGDGQHATWNVAAAKANFSKVIASAQQMPQVIIRHGKPNAVVVSIDEWERKPLVGANLELERLQDEPADVSV